jgi:hypothetical protein
MEFKVASERPGATGRLDLCLELPDSVYVIIELKYCPNDKELENLAKSVNNNLSKEIIEAYTAKYIRNKIDFFTLNRFIYDSQKKFSTRAEEDEFLTIEVGKFLTVKEQTEALADIAIKKLTEKTLNDIIIPPIADINSKDKIDAVLSKAVQEALDDIEKRDYHGIVKLEAKKIIDLGLAVCGYGSQVKAAFR